MRPYLVKTVRSEQGRQKKGNMMSLKESMIRGLAVYGLSSMSQCGRANSSTLVDLINEANKNAR